MASFRHESRKSRTHHQHTLRLKSSIPELKKLAPKIEREIRAIYRKYRPVVDRAIATAKAKKPRRGRSR